MKSSSSAGRTRGLIISGLVAAGAALGFFLWGSESTVPATEGAIARLADPEARLSPIQSAPETGENPPEGTAENDRLADEVSDGLGIVDSGGREPGRSDPTELARLSESERINRAIQRGLEIKAMEAGIVAAQANPGPPPPIAQALRQPAEVPVALERASRQPDVTPPEVLDALYAEPSQPQDILQAMQEASARGTSDEVRAFMAGETDVRPPELGGPVR
jgi:hypothetical protein